MIGTEALVRSVGEFVQSIHQCHRQRRLLCGGRVGGKHSNRVSKPDDENKND
jgi:hypothetical protein